MTDRGIIFSAPMVRALLDGRKTQTRRLATSPLRRCEPGDRLWVRETWSHTGHGVWSIADARRQISGKPIYRATDKADAGTKFWPSIHMPREFSRLTLIVEAVNVEPLMAIGEAVALAEGVERSRIGFHKTFRGGPLLPWRLNPVDAFADLWGSLHTAPGERWADNPPVVALTFRVEHRNIDHGQSGGRIQDEETSQ